MINIVLYIMLSFYSQKVEGRQDKIMKKALSISTSKLKKEHARRIIDAKATVEYLTLQLASKEQEVFSCLYLDTRHNLIEYKEMFYGTIDSCSVYPREVVRYCIRTNAAAVVFAHNHPSGMSDPSQADKDLTNQLKSALSLIDVRVLDHIVIGRDAFSFAENGIL